MKLLRYGAPGAEKPGLLDADGRVRDLSAVVPDIAGQALLPEGLAALRDLDVASLPVVDGVPQQDLRLGPCVGGIGKFICIGLNYADHAKEAGMPIGNQTWDNTRSEMGQQVYRLKYLNDYSVIPKIVQLISKQITAEGFDYIIPVPASKVRPRQPVDAIAQAVGAKLCVPVLTGFLSKTSNAELKGMNDPEDRERLLKESIHIAGSENTSAMNVLIIDDLYRSGATLRACCDVLKEKGNVGEVWVLTMTKTRCHQ